MARSEGPTLIWDIVFTPTGLTVNIAPGMRILDVGSGKGFILHDFRESVPGVEVAGIDISSYGVEHTMEDVKPFCQVGTAAKLPYPDRHFDLVISINTLHNLYNYDLYSAFREIERVGRGAKYICVEGYRNELEQFNLEACERADPFGRRLRID